MKLVLSYNPDLLMVSATFFRISNHLYTLFSVIGFHCEILCECTYFYESTEYDTRWEPWISAVKPLLFHFKNSINDLTNLQEKRNGATVTEAIGLNFYFEVCAYHDYLIHFFSDKEIEIISVSIDFFFFQLKLFFAPF